ncbi:hypothetical protein SPSYN_01829 [Sporotomaculum syntrophicum]|uniref:Uncharacterized protein n=1 Tax=Sporotomaculum syntrophicum TaxID=182264 RepID=A0A9D2WRA7_9FIRM|nr:hypothetical protein [Sporotomaculum syntrophicum]KAF1085685.1 hypothetical protein SPSYN_01829 [Sporotomaculum syntrophicum]
MEFTEKKQKQLEYLQDAIINGQNKDKFLVIDTEAGLGKSLETEKTLALLYMQNPKIKSIFVQKFKNTDKNFSHKRINKLAGKEIAIAIDASNYKEHKKKLKNFNVLIITHEKYKVLSKDKKQRKIFSEDRSILIIDEMIDMLEVYLYNKLRFAWFEDCLPRELRPIYNECINELENFLVTNKGKSFFNSKNKDTGKMIKEFKKLIQVNITPEYAKTYRNEISENKTPMKKSDFLNEVHILEQFYKHTSVVDNQNAYTYDSDIQYWMLNNNIILDANGGFQYLYKISDIFEVRRQAKIVDHRNWTLHIADINTTKSKKLKAINFYDQIRKHIEGILKPEDKLFICGSKDDEQYIKIEHKNISINHFLNVIGKNDWKDFNKAYLIHTPNIPFHVFVLRYLYYSKKKMDNRSNWNLVKNGRVMIFKNKDFNKVRIAYLVSELYQTVKRINRNNEYKADVYILNNDSIVIEMLKKQMKNVKSREFDLDIEYKKAPKQNPVEKENYVDKFIQTLKIIPFGKYKKKYLREKIGCENKSYYSNKVLNHMSVKKYMKDNNILSIGQSIIKNA